MVAESVQILQDKIKLYEDGVLKLLKLIVEIDEKRSTLNKAEKRLDKLSGDETELGNERSMINRQISLNKESRDMCERKLSRARSETSVKELTEATKGWALEVQVYEKYLEKVNGDLEALAREMQPLKVEAFRLGAELERLTALRDNLFDSFTNSPKLGINHGG